MRVFKTHKQLIFNLLISLIVTVSLTFNRIIKPVDFASFLKVFEADSVISFVIFMLFFYFFKQQKINFQVGKNRKTIITFSFILSMMYIIGSDVTYTQATLRGVIGKYSILTFIILLLCSFISIYTFSNILVEKYKEVKWASVSSTKYTFNIRTYLKLLLPYIGIRIIFFFIFFPGSTTWDGMYILKEGLGYLPLSNSHPYLYTFILGKFAQFGWAVFGGVGIGVAIFNFLTLVLTSIIVVYVLYRFFSLFTISPWLKKLIYLFYLSFPNFVVTSFTTYKDTHLMNALLVFFMCMILIQYKPTEFFGSKLSQLSFILSFLFVFLLHRKAVIYLVVGVIALVIYNKKLRSKIIKLSLIATIFTVIFNTLGTIILKPVPSIHQYDYLAPRFQQLAAAMKYHPETFTESEKQFYDDTLGLEHLEYFSYLESDPIKNTMKNESFKGREKEFFKIWAKGYLKHPKTYIDAVLNLSVSYWSPYSVGDQAYLDNYYYLMYTTKKNWFGNDILHDKGWNQNTNPDFLGKLYKLMRKLHEEFTESIVFSIFYRSGIYTMILIIMWMLSRIRKDKDIMPLILLVFSVILTCVFSPIVNYFRYAYIFVMLVPLIFPLILVGKQSENTSNNLRLD